VAGGGGGGGGGGGRGGGGVGGRGGGGGGGGGLGGVADRISGGNGSMSCANYQGLSTVMTSVTAPLVLTWRRTVHRGGAPHVGDSLIDK